MKMNDDDCTIFHAADAGDLIEAARETIAALRKHGYTEHADAIESSMASFMGGASMVTIATLRHWSQLFDAAWELLANSPLDDPGIADDTADIAHGYVCRELSALGAGAAVEMASADV